MALATSALIKSTQTAAQFDAVFEKYRGSIPIEYVRTLAYFESGWNPNAVHKPANISDATWGPMPPGKKVQVSSGAVGLFQITEVVRKDAGVSRADLLNPETNTRVALGLLNRIVSSWANVPGLSSRDWRSRRWVELLTFGWNAGYSKTAGVAFAAAQLAAEGVKPEGITVTAIHAWANRTGKGSAWLAVGTKADWARKVADTYLKAIAGGRDAGLVATRKGAGAGAGPGLALGLMAGLGVVVAVAAKRKKRRL
jgi:hypothetical protein